MHKMVVGVTFAYLPNASKRINEQSKLKGLFKIINIFKVVQKVLGGGGGCVHSVYWFLKFLMLIFL